MESDQFICAGIVGIGDALPAHVRALRRMRNVRIVGVCDEHDSLGVKRASVEHRIPMMPSLEGLRHGGAVIVHVLTAPAVRADVAIRALDLGCHVFIERPAALDVADCRAIANVAAARRLHVCVGHALSFEPRIQRALDGARSGTLGRVISVDLLRSAPAPAYTGGPLPAQLRSAGSGFRDLGGDALHLFEALLGPIEHVQSDWKSLGAVNTLAFDEWRAQVRCRDGMGQFQLSWNVRPAPRDLLLIQGTRRAMKIEAVPSEHGVRELITRFYDALPAGGAAPVTVADVKRIVQWTERIARLAEQEHRRRLAHHRLSDRVPYLVTDGAGALGRALVARLRDERTRVRVIVPRPPESTIDGVEAAIGDLRDPDAVDRAVRGAHVVLNTSTSPSGTENLVHACLNHNVEKLVHVSSLDVLDVTSGDRGEALRESSRIEPRPLARDPHTRLAIEAEHVIAREIAQHRLPAVILRVGQLFGDDIPLVTRDIAQRIGDCWIVLGDGRRKVPLIHVDDVVDAILRTGSSGLEHGEIIHLVDDAAPMQRDVLAAAVERDATIIHLPRWLVILAAAIVTGALNAFGRESWITPYRARCAMSRCWFGSDQRDLLEGWRPTVGLHGAILRYVSHARGRLARVVPADELLIDAKLPSLGSGEPRA